jgi:hypothetical protein
MVLEAQETLGPVSAEPTPVPWQPEEFPDQLPLAQIPTDIMGGVFPRQIEIPAILELSRDNTPG